MRNYTDGMLVLVTEAYYIPENDEIETRITEATSMEIQAADPDRFLNKIRKRTNIVVMAYDANNMAQHLENSVAHKHSRELFSITTSWGAKYPETLMKFGPLHEDNPAEIIMNNKQHEAFVKKLATEVTKNIRSGKISVNKLVDFKYRDNGWTIPDMHSFQRSIPRFVNKSMTWYQKDHDIMNAVVEHLGKVADGELNVLDFKGVIEGPLKRIYFNTTGRFDPRANDDINVDLGEAMGVALTHGLGDENILDTTMDAFKGAMAVTPTKIGGRNKQSPDDIIKAYTSEGTLEQTAVRLRALRSGSSYQPVLIRGLYNKTC